MERRASSASFTNRLVSSHGAYSRPRCSVDSAVDSGSRDLIRTEQNPDRLYGGKKSLNWFIILESMGAGAYGQVKLAQYKPPRNETVVLKFVTKKRILIDTWIRDRKLGTIPLEIHVLQYLRDYPHPNVVDMLDFFEDETNYYIEMAPHGLPGMDLFDYIELRTNMDEAECRSIFCQIASAVQHLHNVGVVHRDIKDENIVLDGDGKIKLIDFGSAAYVKNGPFSVFVGTIDYAAPEVLRGKSYGGKEQDVWAAGVLLYTIVYKENPFYDANEIMNSELRIPHIMSEESVSLIKRMLHRDVDSRPTMRDVLNDSWLKDCKDILPVTAVATDLTSEV
ncbi:kinase-like domain-containing protein [Lipomyces arxii]|uniref:kinase-like domain-containing protein n=1 Tax=Lipomyces arxii TaxID=56418 RepID=UPI0034CE6D4E